MKAVSSLLGLAAMASVHYTFGRLVYDGTTYPEWEYVPKTENRYSNGPVTAVSSVQMGCYQLEPGNEGASTLPVRAGSTVGFKTNSYIQHPGPLAFYIAKAPSAAASFDSTQAQWFKVWQEHPSITSTGLVWDSDGQETVTVQLPSCLQGGEYLLRVEHIGLHAAQDVGGAQFYISCAQISVSGGSGSMNASGRQLVSLPSAYEASHPGIQMSLWWPIPTGYENPGPDPVTC